MSSMESIAAALQRRRTEIQTQWSRQFVAAPAGNKSRLPLDEVGTQMRGFLDVFVPATAAANADIGAAVWSETKLFLDDLSRQRAAAGFAADETATFIFSLKRPLFDALRAESGAEHETFADAVWTATTLLDALGLHTLKAFQKAREDVIVRQQQELLELSTPVVKLWDGILALPMIGTLDSARTQIVMESLLQKIVDTESQIAIIDITGVPTVDTLVAQHLIKTVTALRLMGAECIISGVRPQIAQTIVHLGVDLQGITTKANLADALALALKRSGVTFTRH